MMRNHWMTLVSTIATLLFGCGDDGDAGSDAASQRSASTGNAAGEGGSGGSLAEEACGWEGDDPGGLVATGNAIGDIIADVQGLTDQCGETRSLWDFAGGYRIVVLAEAW